MSLNEEERVLLEQDALKMAETFNEFFQQPNTIAVTGGVEGVDVTEENRIKEERKIIERNKLWKYK